MASRTRDGSWEFPESIPPGKDQARGKLVAGSRGNIAIVQIFWAAYRWTGDEKYLLPIRSEMTSGRLHNLDLLNSDVIDMIGERATWEQLP